MTRRWLAALAALLLGVGLAHAHITPPVVLMSDRDALVTALAGARRFFVREVRLSPAEKDAVAQRTRWTPDEDFYRFYVGSEPSPEKTQTGGGGMWPRSPGGGTGALKT